MASKDLEEFALKFQSFEGISDILKEKSVPEIIYLVSLVSGIAEDNLKALMTLTLGEGKGSMSCLGIYKELRTGVSFYQDLYRDLSDPVSGKTLTSMLKYWLIPDKAFLAEAFSGEEAFSGSEKLLSIPGPDAVKDHIGEVRNIGPGYYLEIPLKKAVTEIYITHKLLSMLNPELIFSLRMTDPEKVVFYAALPGSKMEKLCKMNKPLRLVSLAKDPGAWRNEELLKDKGLVPYLLHRDFGCDSLMVGIDNGDYPYLKDYVRGLRMEFLPDSSNEKKCEWISEHAEDVDILIVNGLYPVNMDIMKIYKEKNPGGITYLPLDANSEWMDRVIFTDPFFNEALGKVDVIGSSGRKMQRHLNIKWPWPIEYYPNGYFHPWVEAEPVQYAEKENTILTVGRLGTEQKATEVMMEAFALAAPSIPGWTLKLVGSIEPSFESYRNAFFEKHPELAERIIFAGKITEKKELFNEYRKAKIFSLTSILEGGTPNVVAEALHMGCAMAVTEFDAYEDATDQGRCGMSAPIGDAEKMAEVYKKLCSDEEGLKKMCAHAYDYAEESFSMEKIVRRLYASLCEAV